MDIIFDSLFDEQLDRLGDYYSGWQVCLHPEEEPPRVSLETYRQGETSGEIWNGRVRVLMTIPKPIAKAGAIKTWFQEREDRLRTVLEGYEPLWDGSNWRGKLSKQAAEALESLYRESEEGFHYPEDLPTYWDAGDWFLDAPDPDKRDVELLVEKALDDGVYLDPDDVQRYLDDLDEDEDD